MLDATRLRVLVAVARYGSVTGAAQALNYAQPSISHHIARLEAETGAKLMERSGRGVKLTEAGQLLADRAEEIIGRLDAAEAELATHVGLRQDRVRLAAFGSALSTLVAAASADTPRRARRLRPPASPSRTGRGTADAQSRRGRRGPGLQVPPRRPGVRPADAPKSRTSSARHPARGPASARRTHVPGHGCAEPRTGTRPNTPVIHPPTAPDSAAGQPAHRPATATRRPRASLAGPGQPRHPDSPPSPTAPGEARPPPEPRSWPRTRVSAGSRPASIAMNCCSTWAATPASTPMSLCAPPTSSRLSPWSRLASASRSCRDWHCARLGTPESRQPRCRAPAAASSRSPTRPPRTHPPPAA